MNLSMQLLGVVYGRVQDLKDDADINRYKKVLEELTEEELIKLIAVGIITLHELYDRGMPVKLEKLNDTESKQ